MKAVSAAVQTSLDRDPLVATARPAKMANASIGAGASTPLDDTPQKNFSLKRSAGAPGRTQRQLAVGLRFENICRHRAMRAKPRAVQRDQTHSPLILSMKAVVYRYWSGETCGQESLPRVCSTITTRSSVDKALHLFQGGRMSGCCRRAAHLGGAVHADRLRCTAHNTLSAEDHGCSLYKRIFVAERN